MWAGCDRLRERAVCTTAYLFCTSRGTAHPVREHISPEFHLVHVLSSQKKRGVFGTDKDTAHHHTSHVNRMPSIEAKTWRKPLCSFSVDSISLPLNFILLLTLSTSSFHADGNQSLQFWTTRSLTPSRPDRHISGIIVAEQWTPSLPSPAVA